MKIKSKLFLFLIFFYFETNHLSIPLSLSTKSWDFEIGYTFNFPSRVESEPALKTTSFFHISIGYLIDLK